ncbi:MAG: aromatic ring-hydroxylating dioxygenase subunit alpha [Pseudomonadota bacterium]
MNLLEQTKEITTQSIGRAEALPFASYHEPDYFFEEQRKIFSRDWVFVCMEANIANPGDYHAVNIAGEPIVVIRGQDGALRAMSNVCRHRGVVMLQGSGTAKNVVCPYHAWTYSDQGQLKAIPHPGDVSIDKASHCLPQFTLDTLHGLVFVSLNPDVPPLQERYKGMEKYLAHYRVAEFQHSLPIDVDQWQTNWKLPMENFVEGYHFFAVHKNTVETVAATRDCFYVEGHADWSITAGKQLDYPATLRDWLRGKGNEVHYLSICFPPNLVCNLYDGYITWARVLPTGAGSTEIATGYAAIQDYKVSKSIDSIGKKIITEDKQICELAQLGTQSRRTKGGRLVEMERAVVDFHQYLGKMMFGKDHSRHFRADNAGLFDGSTDKNAAKAV